MRTLPHAVLAALGCLLLVGCGESKTGINEPNGSGTGGSSVAGAAGSGTAGVSMPAGGAGGSATTGGVAGGGGEPLPSGPLGWAEAPDTKLQGVCPPERADYDFSRCGPVISAWSGGAADDEGERLIVWGGGHNDYWGNELYAFNLEDLTFERLNDPSPINPTPEQCVPELPDHTPNSKHTYGGLSYIAHARKMYVYGGGGACKPGGFSTDTWTLDLATLAWTRMDPTTGGEPSGGLGASDYDPVSKRVFLSNNSELWTYDLDTNTYEKVQASSTTDYHMTGVVDAERRLFFLMGNKGSPGGGIFAFQIGPGSTYTMEDWTADVTGCDDLISKPYPGLAYDSKRKRIVGWAGGDSVHVFDPDSKSCTQASYSGGPGDQQMNGTNGRWRYLPNQDAFALVNDWLQNAFTFRLPPSTP